jgi:hypothetical protein
LLSICAIISLTTGSFKKPDNNDLVRHDNRANPVFGK